MKEFTFEVKDPDGIHARPAGELVKLAKSFGAQVKMVKDGKEADVKKIFAVMSLAVKQGQTVTIRTEGEDEAEASAQLEAFMKQNL